ncbi:MAG: DUF4406 domain-containing protein [Planctomycetaceae bacterium]
MIATLTKPSAEPTTDCETSRSHVPLIYVAAPYSEPDPVENTHAVIKVADALLDAGFTPLVPHLTLAWHLVSPKSYDTWMAYDHHLLARCDAVLRVPGYSNGATRETQFADDLGSPVIRPRSSDATDCVSAVTTWFNEASAHLELSTSCHRCQDESPGCGDCRCCHVCCRCGGR